MKCLVLLVFVSIFSYGIGLNLPPHFKTCKRSAENHEECLKGAIEEAVASLKDGLPDFKLPSMQPIAIPSMTVGEGTGAVHVVQKYKNVEIYDTVKTSIKKAKLTVTGSEFKLLGEMHFDEVRQEADYDFNGQILVLPIVGQGKSTLKLKDLTTEMEMTGKIFEKKGKNYLEITDFKIVMKPGKVEYDFKNLFNGDERLGNEMNKLLNDNWKEVFEDVKVGYEEFLGAVFKDFSNRIFKHVPFEEVFPL